MIPRLKPNLGWPELTAAFSRGSERDLVAFEQAFARRMGQKYAIAFPYGRTGLAFLLEVMGIKGKEVICPAFTCCSVTSAIVASGNEPVLIDSQERDFNMNLELVPRAVTDKTAALIATSTFGYPVDLDRLDQIRAQYPQLRIIQDCAHSYTAEYKGRPVRLEGEAAIYGLSLSKIITTIGGGMVTTDNEQLAADLRKMRNSRIQPPGWKRKLFRRMFLLALYPALTRPVFSLVQRVERSGLLERLLFAKDKHVIQMPPDYLIGISAFESRLGMAQLEKYERIIAARREVAAFYNKELQDLPGLRLPPLVEGATYSHYVVRIKKRVEFMEAARKQGVQLGRWIEVSIPEIPAYRNRPGNRFPCPVAREIAHTAVTLPISNGMRTAAEVVQIIRDLPLFR